MLCPNCQKRQLTEASILGHETPLLVCRGCSIALPEQESKIGRAFDALYSIQAIARDCSDYPEGTRSEAWYTQEIEKIADLVNEVLPSLSLRK